MTLFFATCAKGVEPALQQELAALGVPDPKAQIGGVHFEGELEHCYRACLGSRTASRILMPVAEFGASDPDRLYEAARQVPWESYMRADQTLAVDANLRGPGLTHSQYASRRVKDAVVDRFKERGGTRPSVDPENPQIRINLHAADGRCTLSLDASGEKLHKRGYRAETGEAPVRETLAAAIVLYTGWQGEAPLYDPMCGSGTLLIEAALAASRTAPGLLRWKAGGKFGFQHWPSFKPKLWRDLVYQVEAGKAGKLEVAIVGSDLSRERVHQARLNAERAGVGKLIRFEQKDALQFDPGPGPGVVLTNPPWGERLGEQAKLEPLYKAFGDLLQARCQGYTVYLFTGNPSLPKKIWLKTSKRWVLWNGPIECRLLKYEIFSGGSPRVQMRA